VVRQSQVLSYLTEHDDVGVLQFFQNRNFDTQSLAIGILERGFLDLRAPKPTPSAPRLGCLGLRPWSTHTCLIAHTLPSALLAARYTTANDPLETEQ
jgi:hypothetical protein